MDVLEEKLDDAEELGRGKFVVRLTISLFLYSYLDV